MIASVRPQTDAAASGSHPPSGGRARGGTNHERAEHDMKRPRDQELALDSTLSDEQFARALCPSTPPDPGIVYALRVLLAAGVECFESCQGGDGHAYPQPTVRFHGVLGAGWRAMAAAQEVALPVRALRQVWDVIDGAPTGPHYELTFRPMPTTSPVDTAGIEQP